MAMGFQGGLYRLFLLVAEQRGRGQLGIRLLKNRN